MTARDTIAHALHRNCVKPNCSTPTDYDYADADAVIAAVRAMPVEDQAELIGGTVEDIAYPEDVHRPVGPWRNGPGPTR